MKQNDNLRGEEYINIDISPTGSGNISSSPQSGTDYSSVNNPYRYSYTKETDYDRFVSALGFTSPYAKAEADRKQKEAEWDAQYAEAQRQEAYNSASEQAKRLSDAGINPNLSGDVSSGDASGEVSPSNLGSPYSDLSAPTLMDFSSILLNGISTAVGVVSGVAQIKNASSLLGIQSDTADIDNIMKLFGISGLQNVFNPDDGLDPFAEEDGEMRDGIYLPSAKTSASDTSFVSLIPKKYRKAYKQLFRKYFKSPKGRGERANEISNAADAFVRSSGRQKVFQGFETDNSNGFLKPINDFNIKIASAQFESYKWYNSEMVRLQKDLDLGKITSEQAEVQAQSLVNDMRVRMFGALGDVVDNLYKTYKNGNKAQQFLTGTLLSSVAAYSQGFLPKVNFGSSSSNQQSFNPSSGYSSSFGSSSLNFGIH